MSEKKNIQNRSKFFFRLRNFSKLFFLVETITFLEMLTIIFFSGNLILFQSKHFRKKKKKKVLTFDWETCISLTGKSPK